MKLGHSRSVLNDIQNVLKTKTALEQRIQTWYR